MKQNLYNLLATFLITFGLAIGQTNAQCLQWLSPSPTSAYNDFNIVFGGAPCNDGTGCAFNEITDYEVYASEAYLMANIIEGGTYSFSICNGVGAGSWVPDFTILSPTGNVDAFGAGDGDGCTITWTASEGGTYAIIINEAGQCGGGPNIGTDNGHPAITCVSGAICATACDAGTLLTTTTDTLCLLETTTIINSAAAIPTGGDHGLYFSNSQGGTGALNGSFVLTAVPDTFEFDLDINGALSINGLPPFSGTWVIYSVVYDNATDPFNSICSTSTDSVIVHFSTLVGVDIDDNGDGTATAEADDFGNLPYTYLWSNNQTTATATGLLNGQTYTVTLTDPFGCTADGSVTIEFGGGGDDPCLEWVNPSPTGGWTDFNSTFGGAPCDDGTGCAFNEIQAFEVFASEAYAIDNFIAGGTYAFSMCNGAGAGTWVPEFTIIAPNGVVDAFGPGDGDGCTITWTASQSGTYLIVINEAGECGGGNNTQTNNGFPAITCIENANCPQIDCAAGELSSTTPQVACGPDATISVATDGSEDIPTAGGHGWLFSDVLGGTGGLAGGFTLTGAPLTADYNSDLNGIMSGNGLPVLEGLWVIRSVAYSNANTPTATLCSTSTDSLVVNFAPNSPTVTAVDNGNGSATATGASGAGSYTYQWSGGQTTATINNLASGQYTVTVTDANGCTGVATVNVVSTGVGTIESLEALSISPNPTEGRFVVDIELNSTQNIQIAVLDVTGRELARMKDFAAEKRFSFDLSQHPASVYLLKITVGGDTMVNRVVVTR